MLYSLCMLTYHKLSGAEGRPFAKDLARLRLKVFYDFPYLYDGSIEYEEKYLETYFRAEYSYLFLVEDAGKIVGATTSIWANEEEVNFKIPFKDNGIDPTDVFYFGESVLEKEYRGKGIGKRFFAERESYARSLPFIKYLSFCSVIRPVNHPMEPVDHKSLDIFWKKMGFHQDQKIQTSYAWKDRNEKVETAKTMQFWLKQIR